MSKRLTPKALMCSLGLAGAITMTAGNSQASSQDTGSVTIFPAGTVITMNPEEPEAEAVAISGDRILATGALAQLKKGFPERPVTVDDRFADKVLVPGLINQHEHPWLSALTLSTHVISIEDWNLPEHRYPKATNPQQYRELLEAAVASHGDEAGVFYSWGYHKLWHGELTRGMLDEISTTVPIVIWQRSAHELIFNTPALETFGISQEVIDQFPEHARAQTDHTNGHFWEQGAMILAPRLFKRMAAPERFVPALKMLREYWHNAGSTWVVEPGGLVNKGLLTMQNSVFGSADTPFHMDYIPDGKTMALQHMDNLIPATENLLDWGQGMSRFLPGQVKLFTDGAIFSQLMKMKDGYLDGHEGEWIISPDLFREAFRKYWEAGYQIHVHHNGDEGLELLLDTIEENQQRHPRPDHRTVIVHFGFSTPEQVERIAELGAIISANPYYPIALGDMYSHHGIGPERAHEMVRLGDVVEAGIPFSLHADMPMAPGKPLFLMWSAVNRIDDEGNVIGTEHRISPEQALRAVTLGAAYSMGMEDRLGSIEAGKMANLTVLEQNPLTVPPMTIKDIGVWGTIHEGRVLPVSRKD